jgi:H+/Cl- antiporter ClcA
VSADQDREWARHHLERVRRLKLHVAAFVVGMVVLTPVWALTQWQTSGGFERWSTDHSHPGDWEPWILYVALVWGLVVAIAALKVYVDRPTRGQAAALLAAERRRESLSPSKPGDRKVGGFRRF